MIKNQEIHDKNTGVHLAIGTHATKKDATTGQDLDPRHWLRITVKDGEAQKISTVYFDDRGEVQRIDAHEPVRETEPDEVSPEMAAKSAVGEAAEESLDANDPLP